MSAYTPRRIKQKWINKVHPNRSRCVYCWKEKEKVVQATWREYGGYEDLACDEHKDKIYVEDDHMSEADYQTWGRL